jgi:putative transposase
MIGLAVSSFYYHPKLAPRGRGMADADLRDKIEGIQAEFPRYGYRRMKRHLQREGLTVNAKRIRRVMRAYGLLAEIRQAFVPVTTDSDHAFPVYENLVKHREVNGPNEIWVGDITYIRIATGFVYLAVLLDLFSRKVIGWAIARRLHRELCLAALHMALETREPPPGGIHHSDRGVQYASHDYVALLQSRGLQISMARKGNPYDNAYAESFMKTLKHEEVSLWNYETYAEVIERLPYFIEEVYNKTRLHSALGYVPPEEFEQRMRERTQTVGNQQLNLNENPSS